VLGFLSVSTDLDEIGDFGTTLFQSRAGFSECLDLVFESVFERYVRFQSRAGFSECLDLSIQTLRMPTESFNPVLGFLSVSTASWRETQLQRLFQSRAGFSECLDNTFLLHSCCCQRRFNPVLGFLSVSTGSGPFRSDAYFQFQSRAGFSECLDTTVLKHDCDPVLVSIPCWVF